MNHETTSRPRILTRKTDRPWFSRIQHLSFILHPFSVLLLVANVCFAESPRIATFDVDASPRIGTPMAYDPTREVTIPLRCRGIVLLSSEEPIVLCAVDWLGIANESNEMFRSKLASAAGTKPERVAIHCLHQHDAPRCDGSAWKIVSELGRAEEFYDAELWEKVAERAASSIQISMASAVPVERIGIGSGLVHEVASNRRILGPDGKVAITRYTATKDPEVRAKPVGVIDPMLRTLAFFSGEKCVVALTYYATHPQSYYRTGQANPDFPGIARNKRQEETGVLHVHFNGAGGNIGAGKYNDGSIPVRQELADKVAAGMKLAWEGMKIHPLDASEVQWSHLDVQLPLAKHLNEPTLLETLKNPSTPPLNAILAAEQLAFVRRTQEGKGISISCLKLPGVALLHMPGELFVEYQLAASKMRTDLEVMMASYGDYGPFYIGTEVAYPQGGYETSPGASNVSPDCESVLLGAMRKLLNATDLNVTASDFTDKR